MDNVTKSYIKIAIAGGFWGTIGIFVQTLRTYGLTSEMIAFSRLFLGSLIMIIIFYFKNPSILKIDKQGLWASFLIGAISQGFFNIAYFQSIQIVGSFTAVVLLYFSPVFMFIFGTIMYKEAPNKRKIISVLICFFGCVYGVTGGDFSVLESDLKGIIMGILGSLSYSLMPALSKKTASRYNPFTIIIYSFMFGAILLLPFANPVVFVQELKNLNLILMLILFSFMVAVIPYSLYIPSLHNVQVSRLGVIASVELIVSIFIAAFILKETINTGNIIGASLILLSIILMNGPLKKSKLVKKEIDYPKDFIDELKNKIEELLKNREIVVIGIDGRCASGKTTFAQKLSKSLDANLFHGDDFYLPVDMRTKERIGTPGGNIHHERLLKEVIIPVKNKQIVEYRSFSCESQSYLETKEILPKRINIVEGAYIMTNELYENYDFTIFMTTSPQIQLKRLLVRNKEGAKRFEDIWIPLEERYISFYNLGNKCDFTIDTTDFF